MPLVIFENGTEYANNEKPKTISKYNELNQLISSKTDGLIVNNEYNAEGLRISKSVENSTIDTIDKNYYTYEYDKVIFETSTKNLCKSSVECIRNKLNIQRIKWRNVLLPVQWTRRYNQDGR